MKVSNLAIEKWIKKNFKVLESDSAHVAFDKMERQCSEDIPGVYRKYNPANLRDWLAMINEMFYIDPLWGAERVLDFGCGDGYPILNIAPYVKSAIGIDYSPKRVEVSKQNSKKMGLTNTEFYVMNGESLEYSDNYFDGVVSATAIEQAARPEKVFSEVYRVLKPGGVFAAAFQNLSYYIGTKDYREVCEICSYRDNCYYVYRIENKSPSYEKVYYLQLKKSSVMEDLEKRFIKDMGDKDGISLEDPDTNPYAIQLLEKIKGNIAACEYFKIRHFTEETVIKALKNAGFNSIDIEPYKPKILLPVLKGMESDNLLQKWGDSFEAICRNLSKIKCAANTANSHVIFIRAKK